MATELLARVPRDDSVRVETSSDVCRPAGRGGPSDIAAHVRCGLTTPPMARARAEALLHEARPGACRTGLFAFAACPSAQAEETSTAGDGAFNGRVACATNLLSGDGQRD